MRSSYDYEAQEYAYRYLLCLFGHSYAARRILVLQIRILTKETIMHKCLTCFREFRLDQVHYRCVKPGCTAKDEKLSRHMKGTVQIMGTAITPENLPGGKAGKAKGGSQIPCPECQSLTTIRLCPHCHGELPSYLDDVPGHTVFIVGPRGSGKSVYLVVCRSRRGFH